MNRHLSFSGSVLKFACCAVVVAVALTSTSTSIASGILFVGSDHSEFRGLPEVLGIYRTSGASIVGGGNVNPPYFFNGLGEGPGYLHAGQYNTNLLRRIDYAGNSLSTFVGAIPNTPFNEDMAWNGTHLFHAYYGSNGFGQVARLDPITGAALETDNLPFGVVGAAFVGSDLWITDWAGARVGTYDMATNIFTPKFNTPDLAGGLAYDPLDNVLWVGMRGGLVVPYNPITGLALNAGFQPFGDIPDTIDGLAFVANVPEPTTLALCSLMGAGFVGYRLRRRNKAVVA